MRNSGSGRDIFSLEKITVELPQRNIEGYGLETNINDRGDLFRCPRNNLYP
jgi:hypothetical protein